jgi:hypothetical protein
MRNRSISIALTLSLALLTVLSCSWPGFGPQIAAVGSLQVTMDDAQAAASNPARTIWPPLATRTVTYYMLKAAGPAPTNRVIDWFQVPVEGYTLSDLEAGLWSIEAEGRNAADQPVTYGSTSTTVSAGATTYEIIDMNPYSEVDGSCTVTVSWTTGLGISNSGVELKTEAGAPVEWTPITGPITDGFTCSGTLAAGMYRLELGFTYGLKTIWVSDALQIFGGLESSATMALVAADFTSPPAAPDGLLASDGLDRTIVLTWNDNSFTEEGFILERKVKTDESWGDWSVLGDEQDLMAGSKTYTDADVSWEHEYCYRISSTNAIGDSAPSAEYLFPLIRVTSVEAGNSFYLHLGGSKTMTATVSPADAFDKRVTWESLNPTIAEVDANTGAITPKALGTATIKATTVDDGSSHTDTCAVTICADPVIDTFGFIVALNSAAGVSSDSYGTIEGATITVTVPFGTDPSGLKATFAYAGASIVVGGTSQSSGSTTNDFTNPVTYRVTALDNTFVDYEVTVIFGAPGSSGVTFNPNPSITVSFLNLPDEWLKAGAAFDVTADTSAGVDAYQWYLDGIKQAGATAQTFTISSALNLSYGAHRLAVIVTKDGYSFSHEASFNVVKRIVGAVFGGRALASRALPAPPILWAPPGKIDPAPGQGGARHA